MALHLHSEWYDHIRQYTWINKELLGARLSLTTLMSEYDVGVAFGRVFRDDERTLLSCLCFHPSAKQSSSTHQFVSVIVTRLVVILLLELEVGDYQRKKAFGKAFVSC